MTTRYQKRHYEDVAFILGCHTTAAGMDNEKERMKWLAWIANSFADLFAADNPDYCSHCLVVKGTTEPCWDAYDKEHNFKGGFDHSAFLTACGLGDRGLA